MFVRHQLPAGPGTARVLRAQFALVVSNRAGMGLSWDDEAPPAYPQVPGSPPRYLGSCAGTSAAPALEDHWEGLDESRGHDVE